MHQLYFFKSFHHATRGLLIGIKNERNVRWHGLAVVLVTILSLLLQISLTDYVIFLLLFGLVISAELLNSAIEKICDILRDRYHLPYEGSRDIRDIAAGAVWINALIAAIIGIIIFTKYL
ncbi:diacylglycerol kinase family protein [Candidatus Beckwithbacteria bacterium]|nr:diacylglycerol kinase family protein [Candidatus Beckwithbacteria bacterium]